MATSADKTFYIHFYFKVSLPRQQKISLELVDSTILKKELLLTYSTSVHI